MIDPASSFSGKSETLFDVQLVAYVQLLHFILPGIMSDQLSQLFL